MIFFMYSSTATISSYCHTLSLHDALPIWARARARTGRFESGAEELARALFLRRIEEIVGAALFAEPTAVEEADAVGEFLGEAHLVGDHQHGEVELGAKLSDHVQHLADQLRVERRGDIVDKHDLGPHG